MGKRFADAEPACLDCKYRTPGAKGSLDFICRRFPPVQMENESKRGWPRVSASDWCGEFAAKDDDA